MNFRFLHFCAILALCLPVLPLAAQDDGGVSSRRALGFLEQRFGADKFQGIVSMRGTEGVSQPDEWEVVVHDPASPYNLRYYWVDRKGDTSNEGPADDFYPSNAPDGFVMPRDVKVDSMAAFTIAEGEARKAKVGFDYLNYLLKAREFSREPIWRLELIDTNKKLAGAVFISGETGEVLRTVWITRTKGPRGQQMTINDSYAPDAVAAQEAAVPPVPTTTPGTVPVPVPPVVPPPVDPQSPLLPRTGEPGTAPGTPVIPPPVIPNGGGTSIPPPPPAGGADTRIPPPPIP